MDGEAAFLIVILQSFIASCFHFHETVQRVTTIKIFISTKLVSYQNDWRGALSSVLDALGSVWTVAKRSNLVNLSFQDQDRDQAPNVGTLTLPFHVLSDPWVY